VTSLRWGAATDVGRVRTNNEDSLLVEPPLFAVADGMGGAAAGEVASAIAVATVKAGFNSAHSRDALAEAVRHANDAIFERARQDPTLRGMGTTLTAVALVHEDDDDVLAVVNVGDSRAYRMRDGELERITDDHSLVEEMVRSGRLSPDEAAVHPQRHIVTRALGVYPDVEVDCFGITPFAGDRYLLASDGLMDEVEDPDIASILRRHPDPDDAARELVDLAKGHGGRDNVTVVIVDVVDDDDRAAKAAALIAENPPTPRPSREPEALREDGPPPAERTPPPPSPRATTTTPTKQPKQPRVTGKSVLFLLALIAVLAGAFAAIGFYARGSYYVGVHDGEVVIFQGRPGGLLWFKPTVKERTGLQEADVPPAFRSSVADGKTEPSLDDAEQYVRNLKSATTTTTTTTTTSTTTAPPPTSPTSAP
jgi:protein phosphatase